MKKIILSLNLALSTFGNDCILSSFFSFILTSNKVAQCTSRSRCMLQCTYLLQSFSWHGIRSDFGSGYKSSRLFSFFWTIN